VLSRCYGNVDLLNMGESAEKMINDRRRQRWQRARTCTRGATSTKCRPVIVHGKPRYKLPSIR
jgi:hypothetical protein